MGPLGPAAGPTAVSTGLRWCFCIGSIYQRDPEVFLGARVFGEASNTKANKPHFFWKRKVVWPCRLRPWFVGLGTPCLQTITWPQNHFGIPSDLCLTGQDTEYTEKQFRLYIYIYINMCEWGVPKLGFSLMNEFRGFGARPALKSHSGDSPEVS